MANPPSPSDKDSNAIARLRSLFEGRKLVIATMHGKEKVMAPLASRHLFVLPEVAPLNTDAFGTFTGETPRPDDALTTLRKKILHALALTGETLGMGSEGSFGPHPALPWVPADHEWVMLIDQGHGWEWHANILSTDTNYAQTTVSNRDELRTFAEAARFPDHGLILRLADGTLIKDITEWELLTPLVTSRFQTGESVQVETDMRAHRNPLRMRVIEQATQALIEKMYSLCPQCGTPGFSMVAQEPGLPCEQCGSPTRLVQTEVRGCQHCNFTEGKRVSAAVAPAMYCDFCNP